MPRTETQIENLLRRLIGDDQAAAAEVLERSCTSSSPSLLAAAALLADSPDRLLITAADHATSTRDRQLVAIATARVRGDEDLLDALVRDHLADYPDNLLAAWIATRPNLRRDHA